LSFYIEWERLAEQAYAQIPLQARGPVAEAIIDLMRNGLPERAESGKNGAWCLRAGAYFLLFTIDDDLDIYLTHIERA
jgi:hypothetical protein